MYVATDIQTKHTVCLEKLQIDAEVGRSLHTNFRMYVLCDKSLRDEHFFVNALQIMKLQEIITRVKESDCPCLSPLRIHKAYGVPNGIELPTKQPKGRLLLGSKSISEVAAT